MPTKNILPKCARHSFHQKCISTYRACVLCLCMSETMSGVCCGVFSFLQVCDRCCELFFVVVCLHDVKSTAHKFLSCGEARQKFTCVCVKTISRLYMVTIVVVIMAALRLYYKEVKKKRYHQNCAHAVSLSQSLAYI